MPNNSGESDLDIQFSGHSTEIQPPENLNRDPSIVAPSPDHVVTVDSDSSPSGAGFRSSNDSCLAISDRCSRPSSPALRHPGDDNACMATVPLLLRHSYARSKSVMCDELRNFRVSLKWWALDQSSESGKILSWFTFVVFAVFVPVMSSLFVKVPRRPTAFAFDKFVQVPESGLAAIAFFSLSRFSRRYGLRQILFLDQLGDDSPEVRQGYTQELDKSFKYLAWILLPSFSVELVHKIMWFSTVTVTIPFVHGRFPANSIMFIAVLAAWVYRRGVFLLVCVLFRLICQLQILRFEGFKKLLEGCGSDSGVIFREHTRIRHQLFVTSHRFRLFIVGSLVTITVSQLSALVLVLSSKAQKDFFNSGDLVVCSAVELSGFFLCLLGAARITHRAQGVVSVAARWHMLTTCASIAGSDSHAGKNQFPVTRTDEFNAKNYSSDSESSEIFVVFPSKDVSAFETRQALVTYLQHNNGGITLFGFTLDRGLLHTLFAFEFSLVLWILSKVVVLQ